MEDIGWRIACHPFLARRLDEVNGQLIRAWGRPEPEQRRRFFTETLRKMAAALQIGVPRLRQADSGRRTPGD